MKPVTKEPRILIVEEEAIIALELKLKLESLGFRYIEAATNTKQAMKKADEFQPDLVLSEIFFSGKTEDGITLVKTLKKQFSVEVIFITSLTYLADDPNVQHLKPLAVIGKPYREEDLISVLQAKYSLPNH
ncbi:hypothetical protein B6D60_02480 [candidate division KSB1 bacterium 4484_87]|nr:MAG: hypothetical protein B6D60_02480 [candidate division KSB1 bacterium 4484_87]